MNRAVYTVIGFTVGGICSTSAFAQGEVARSDLFSQPPGRYQIVMSSVVARNTFLLDTATGKVWQLIEYTDLVGNPTAWKPMFRLDLPSDRDGLVREYGFKPKEPAATAVRPSKPSVNPGR
jgi:hypothetical protein